MKLGYREVIWEKGMTLTYTPPAVTSGRTDGSYGIGSAKPVRGMYANGEIVELGWFTNEALLEALGERIG